MKFGIIGYQHFHIDQFINLMLKGGHEFAGVVDADKDAALSCSNRYHVPVLEKNEELLRRNIDLVGTADIPLKRIEVLEWAENNHVHFVSDKALVINRKGLEKLEKIIERDQIKIGMILDFRYNGLAQQLKEEIEKGTLGKIVNIIFMMPHKLRPEIRPEWFWDQQRAGSIITDLMIHSVDLFRWFLNSEVICHSCRVGRKTKDLPKDFNDHGTAMIESETGVLGTIYVDWLIPSNYYTWSDTRIFCQGTDGFAELRVTGEHTHKAPALFINCKGAEKTLVWEQMPSAVDLGQDMVNKISGNPETLLKKEDILECSRLCIDLDEII